MGRRPNPSSGKKKAVLRVSKRNADKKRGVVPAKPTPTSIKVNARRASQAKPQKGTVRYANAPGERQGASTR
jgi:hypothetical protein